jgi:RNA 3'-terminal phosphate cyclase (GTP)
MKIIYKIVGKNRKIKATFLFSGSSLDSMIELDGSQGEGGGSILRQALALSILAKKPFRITKIRANRPVPGLKSQHLAALELAQRVSNAKVLGARPGSVEVEFYPGDLSSKEISCGIGTAGSITLALQPLIFPYAFSDKKLKITLRGGTDVAWSPPVDYFREVFLPGIEDYCRAECAVQKKGYYPKGGGAVSFSIEGKNSSRPLKKDNPGKPAAVKCILHTSKNFWKNESPEKTAELVKISFSDLKVPVSINTLSSSSDDEGGSILFYAVYEDPVQEDHFTRTGCSEIFRDDREVSKVIELLSAKLKSLIKSNIPVDENLADQLIPLLGIVGGSIKTNSITEHTLSNIYVAEKFLDKKFEVDPASGRIDCR